MIAAPGPTPAFSSALRGLLILILTAGILAAVHGGLRAQSASPAVPPASETVRPTPEARLNVWRIEIEAIAAALRRESLSPEHFEELRSRAERVRADAADMVAELAPRLAAARARLAELGPAPAAKPGEPAPPESEGLRAEREAQARIAAALDGSSRQAEVVRLSAEEVLQAIADRRRERFTRRLLEYSQPILAPALWLDAAEAAPRLVAGLGLLVRDWWSLTTARGGSAALAAIAAALAMAALLLIPVRRLLVVHAARNAAVAEPALLDKTASAAAVLAVNVVAPLAALGGIYIVVDAFDLAPQRVDDAFKGLISAVGVASLVYGIGRALLSPAKAQWRLVGFGDGEAKALMSAIAALAAVVGVGRFGETLLDLLSAPVAPAVVWSGLTALAEAGLLVVGARIAARAVGAVRGAAGEAEAAARGANVLWRWLLPLAWAAAIAVFAAALLGYVGLSRFLARQTIWTGIVLSTLYLLLALVDEAITAAFRPTARIGAAFTRGMGFADRRVEQAGVVLSGLARLGLAAVAAFLIVSPWGFESGDILGSLRSAFFGVSIGGLSFSLSTLVGAVVVFAVGVFVTRAVQSWLDQRFLPRTELDVGLKTSITTGLGYLGVIVAAVAAFGFAGLDLDNVAIVAGALSVGIGFGLQSIVNNFVSGLILLAERPIKTGDRVQVGAEIGYVRKINVRATEIETLDRASLIVPNSALVSGTVKNWMHRDLTGQVLIDVGVNHGANPERVRDILLEAARAHPHVLKNPEPQVFFTGFGESALQFRLQATVGHVDRVSATQSDLRFTLMKRFREERIDIPFVQRDLHISNLDEVARLVGHLAGGSARGDAEPGR